MRVVERNSLIRKVAKEKTMMNKLLFLCFLLPLVLIFGQDGSSEGRSNAGSEDPRNFKHPLTDMPAASEDIETTFYFPQHTDLKLPIGEVVTVLCHFVNKGSASSGLRGLSNSYYNISAIMGSLNSPYDFRHHFQNYSYKPIGMVIKNDEEITLSYQFQLHPDLEPIDYQLAVTVFYDSEVERFSTTFFNQTVELYLPKADYDLETVSSLLYSLLLTIAVVLTATFACFPESKASQHITKVLKTISPSSFASVPGSTAGGYSFRRNDDDVSSFPFLYYLCLIAVHLPFLVSGR
jgi:hypothetical protein